MPEATLHEVTTLHEGQRLDRVVAALAGLSRAKARELVDGGAVLLDGRPAARSVRVTAGAELTLPATERAEKLPEASVEFTVAFEDDLFLIVDKPARLVVHPGAGHVADTLVNGLVGPYPELREVGEARNWGLVHRLDAGTSGLLLVAREMAAHDDLQAQLRGGDVRRRYLALATGRVFDNATGTIEAPIGRDPRQPTRMAVVESGRPARTHYARLASWDAATLVEVTLETGRTHQIRVHFAAIDAPLLGDEAYGGKPAVGLANGRVWLHAASLGFVHPGTGEPVRVRSALPADLRAVLAGLGEPATGDGPVP